MQHKNPYWLAFLICAALVVFWYTGNALFKAYQYGILDSKTKVGLIDWSVKPLSDESFVLVADYQFMNNQSSEKGQTTFLDKKYWNEWAAMQAIPEVASENLYVWYSSSNPHKSALQKKFPLKECISAAVLWGIFLYFLWIGRYVALSRS